MIIKKICTYAGKEISKFQFNDVYAEHHTMNMKM